MKKIAIFCVTYQSYQELFSFIASVDAAAEQAEGQAQVDVMIADNTEVRPQPIRVVLRHANLHIFPYHQNLGYFGAVGRMMKDTDPLGYDYCIVSNVDLTVDSDAISRLVTLPCAENTGWIAPQIYSKAEDRDLNPKIRHRYSLWRLQLLRIMHRFPILHYIYSRTLYLRNRATDARDISVYAGHGSFIILTRTYFRCCGIIDYPVFLFCEEIYLAELCRRAGLRVVHCPDIRISDREHVSTGRMPLVVYSHYNYEAVSYIIRTFYTTS